jgi:hypothetical protein
VSIEELAEQQGCRSDHRHRAGVEERDLLARFEAGLLEVEAEERPVGVSAGEHSRGRHVDPEDARQILRLLARRRRSSRRVDHVRRDHRHEREERGDGEPEEGGGEMIQARHGHDHEERAGHRAGLVHRGMDAEPPSVADLPRGLREQDVARGST